MRFRAKFVPESWIWFAICGINLAIALGRILSPRHHDLGLFSLNLLTAALALLTFYGYKAASWELDADGLRQRKLWMNTKVRWQDVTRVESVWSAPFYDLKIEYRRHGLGPKIGHILANPTDRDQFLDALRRFAPQAEYIDNPAGKILNI
jgi:hypothetical protein